MHSLRESEFSFTGESHMYQRFASDKKRVEISFIPDKLSWVFHERLHQIQVRSLLTKIYAALG